MYQSTCAMVPSVRTTSRRHDDDAPRVLRQEDDEEDDEKRNAGDVHGCCLPLTLVAGIQQAVGFHPIFHQCLNLSIYCFDQSVKKDYFATLIDCSPFCRIRCGYLMRFPRAGGRWKAWR